MLGAWRLRGEEDLSFKIVYTRINSVGIRGAHPFLLLRNRNTFRLHFTHPLGLDLPFTVCTSAMSETGTRVKG